VYFPRSLLPLAVTLGALVNYGLSLLVQFPLVMVLGSGWSVLSGGLLLLPLLVLLQTMFNFGLALLLSASNVYFRDTPHLVGLLLSAWFFLSPVMYDLDFLRRFAAAFPHLTDLYLLNPLAVLITGYRACILPDVSFPFSAWSLAGTGLILLLLAAGWLIFVRAQRHFADFL